MLKLFIQFEFGKIVKYFKTKTVAKSITGILFLLVFLFVGAGIYAFFVTGFRYISIEALEDTRMALSLFLYELFLVVLGGVIIFSSAVSGIFNLFKGENNNWLLSSPSYKLFPKVVLLRSVFSSSLPSLILFLPAVLALHKVNHFSILSLFFILISVILLLVSLSAITLLALVLIGYSYYFISKKIKNIVFSFKGYMLLLLGIVGTVTLLIGKVVKSIDLVQLFKADIASDVLSVTTISNHFRFLPTNFLALEIISWQEKQTGTALYYLSLLLFIALFFVTLWHFVSPLFYPLWQRFQEGSLHGSTKSETNNQTKKTYQFTGTITMALFKKEILIFTRNIKGVLWFIFLFFIWLAQLGTNVIMRNNIHRYESDITQKVAILQSLQFIIAIYFICSFVLRFVFPAFSVEKKTAWILASAPLSFKKIFFGKYIFYTFFFVGLGLVMGLINMSILNVPLMSTLYSMLLFISTIIFIVTFGLALGAIFPSTETDDPEAISTSMSGLFFTAIALLYGGISTFTLYLDLTKKTSLPLFAFIIITFIGTVALLRTTPALVKKRMIQN